MIHDTRLTMNAIINNLFRFLFSKKVLLAVIFLGFVVFVISIPNRYIFADDAWFGEQAYWFAKEGFVRSPSIIGYYGWEDHLMVYHKLNIAIAAGLISLFGWSPTPMRAFMLCVTLVFFFVYYRYFKKDRSMPAGAWVFAFFILAFNALIQFLSYSYRPEMLVMLFGFGSYISMQAYLKGEGNYRYLLLSGLLAGLAFLTHLNGLIFPVTGAIVLLLFKRVKGLAVFTSGAMLTGGLYFYDLWQEGRFELWIYQLRNWPDDVTSNYLSESFGQWLKSVFLKLSGEYQRFFWSYRIWGISSLFILAILFKGKKLWKEHKPLLVYTLVLILALNILGSLIAERFILYLFPLMGIVIALFIHDTLASGKTFVKFALILIFLLQVVTVGMGYYYLLRKRENLIARAEEVLSRIPEKGTLTLVPYRFIYNEMPNRDLATFKGFEYHQSTGNFKFTKEIFFDRAHQYGITHMVIASEMRSRNDSRFPWIEETFGKTEGKEDLILVWNEEKKSYVIGE